MPIDSLTSLGMGRSQKVYMYYTDVMCQRVSDPLTCSLELTWTISGTCTPREETGSPNGFVVPLVMRMTRSIRISRKVDVDVEPVAGYVDERRKS